MKKIISIVMAILLTSSLCLTSFAASLPANVKPVDSGWISNSELLGGSYLWQYHYTNTSGLKTSEYKPSFVLDSDTASIKFNWVHTSTIIFNHWLNAAIFSVDRMMNLSPDYLYYFGLWVRDRYPVSYSTDSIIEFVQVSPVYSTKDKSSYQIDTVHSVTQPTGFASRVGNDTDVIFPFGDKEYYIPFNPAWLPEGYYLSGFAYFIQYENDKVETPPYETFLFSGFDYKCYSVNSEMIDAINSQTKELQGSIKSAADDINSSLKKQTDEIKGAIQDSVDSAVNEDFGYEQPDTSDIDDGLDDGASILDTVESNLSALPSQLAKSREDMKTQNAVARDMIQKLWDALPISVSVLCIAALLFLVCRKVFGR